MPHDTCTNISTKYTIDFYVLIITGAIGFTIGYINEIHF